MGTLKDLLY